MGEKRFFSDLILGSSNLKISYGTGTPEGSETSDISSLFFRSDATDSNTSLYIKDSGASNTGWTLIAAIPASSSVNEIPYINSSGNISTESGFEYNSSTNLLSISSIEASASVKILNEGTLILEDSGSNTISLAAPTTITSSYSLVLPVATPADGEFLEWDTATSAFIWSTPSGGGSTTLDALTDTDITGTPADGEILMWDNTTDWVNATLVEAGIAAASHVHDATDVTTGTLLVARGGTGDVSLTSGTEYTEAAATVKGHLEGIDTALGIRYESGDTIRAADGLLATPGLSFANSTGTGFYLSTTSVMRMAVNGKNFMLAQDSGAFTVLNFDATVVAMTSSVSWLASAPEIEFAQLSGSSGAKVSLREGPSNGVHTASFTAPDSIAADYSLELPGDEGSAGQVLTTNGSDTLTWETVSGSDIKFDLNQASPTLAVMNAVYHDGADWQKAQADDPTTLGTHVVVSKATDDYELAQAGRVTATAHGLTVGEYYFVSDATAGLLTSTEPTDNYSNPLVYVEDANTIHVLPYRPTFYTEAVVVPYSKSVGLESPGSSEDVTMFFTDDAITVTQMNAVLKGSSTPSVTWTIRHNSDRSATGAEVVTSGTATTSTTTGSEVTSFNDETIPAGSWVWLETTAQSGSVDEINITIEFTRD